MAAFPIALLRDDFTNNAQDALWAASLVTGSATKSESGGQAICTLPSSTAGSHSAYYRTSATYDLTSDGLYFNIGTMVATGVAATATLDLYVDASNVLRWQQLSNAITARTVVAGVDTQLFTATWNSSTYKYLRIRESAGTIFWDSSSNGTSWTNRASVANPFAVTSLTIQFGASCGNVASPGSLRLDDVNLIVPTPSSTWRETTADWGITNRLRPVTLASDGGMQGVLVTADAMDSSRVLTNTRFFGGPLGSTSGGYLLLTEYASLAAAQASPFPIPIDGRVDLAAFVDARYMRLYHRSIDASSHVLDEFVPRRIVQADDIEAESIRAINISAGAVTADKISVINLQAVSANMGNLHMDGVIDIASTGGIYQGSGTFASPTTGLKLFNSGGVGKLSGYNGGTEQITLDTDGKLKAGAGNAVLDVNGVTVLTASTYAVTQAYRVAKSDMTVYGTVDGIYGSGAHTLRLQASSISGEHATVEFDANAPTGKTATFLMTVKSGVTLYNILSASTDGTTNSVVIDALNTSGTITLGSPATLSYNVNIGTYVDQPETSQPATPAANHMRQWITDDGSGVSGVFWIDSTATPVGLTSATAATATTGASGAPPAQVAGYLIMFIAGARRKVPYYNI